MKLKKLISAAISAAMLLGTAPVLQMSAGAASSDHTYKLYDAQTDRQDDIFQYHFAGGTDDFMNGITSTGKTYDAYLWVPPSVARGSLKGLVAIKANLIEVPFVYSTKLKSALADKGFGLLFLVFQKDKKEHKDENNQTVVDYDHRYNNTFCSFNTRKDYAGNSTTYSDNDFTDDGKDAADIMNDILSGIADASGYSEIKYNTPLITIGHSAASPFGYRSGNWNKDRIIAQVHMKNGMWGDADADYVVPGIPSLQYAAQYTEHDKNKGRDRSVIDARWHIDHQRAKDTNMLVSHIIEWGSGHYDWSDNATDMMVKYIQKAIDYRLPSGWSGGSTAYTLNDLTNTGYLMKPFEKDGSSERPMNYYKDTLKGWLSSGQNNSGASAEDKKASYWYFDKEFADEVNAFTNYAIPPSPDSNTTKVEGATYSAIEPYMLMKNPAVSTHANTPASVENEILPMTPFNANMSRYGSNRFVNYTRLANPGADASNSANLQGYDTATVDTYYMTNIPQVTSNDNTTLAYDGAGEAANVPANTKAEFVPLMAPYEIVSSEIVDKSGMTVNVSNSEAANVASVTRTTLRYHNNRVYYSAGNTKLNEYGTQLGSFGMIVSPEIKSGDTVTSAFKVTAVEMNVPYTGKGSQTLTLNNITNVNIKDANADKTFDVTYTSSDSDLQKYTDVFVEYGPARAVRTVEADGSYSWKIEILADQIPAGATYPIPVNVVASNLGKWENVAGATASQVFYITDKDTMSGVYLDSKEKENFDMAFDEVTDSNAHTITLYSDGSSGSRRNMTGTTKISVVNGDFASTLSETGNNMMFLLQNTSNTNPQLTFGKSELTSTNADTALTVKAKSGYFTAEINYGEVNLHHGAIITGGSPANGGAFDIKTSGTVNMDGGIIRGNTATGNNGGGAICMRGYGTLNMSGGIITSNVSEKETGGGVAVRENGTFNMSGGTVSGNTGYDVYVNNNNMKISGSAKIGSLYLASGKNVTVNGAFTTAGSHAEITPEKYEEGTVVATYANGLTPSTSDFTVADQVVTENDTPTTTPWYLKVSGQNLVLTQTRYDITGDGNVTVQDKATQGEMVTVTLPDNYVANSLVVSGVNPSSFTEITANKQYRFTMPGKNVSVSCLVNNDLGKVVVVGTNNDYYIKDDHTSMTVDFVVPALESGYEYSGAIVKVPNRKSDQSNRNIKIKMNNGDEITSTANIDQRFTTINPGATNTLTILYDSLDVDYYSYIGGWDGSGYDYPSTAANLSTLTLTKNRTVYDITGDGNVTVQSTAERGSTVNVTVPAGYVKNSLVVSGMKPSELTKVSDTVYSFTMPSKDVSVSCLVNNDPSKVVVVGTNDSYYVSQKSDALGTYNDMHVTFEVPSIGSGYTYKSAALSIPYRANQTNASNMTASMNDESKNVTANISATFNSINAGAVNTVTIRNQNTAGVDYYCYNDYNNSWTATGFDYPQTASNLSTLTLTKAVYAKTKAFTADEVASAEINKDARGFYIKDLAIPSWNPTLKWVITFNDGKKASKQISSSPILTGEGDINIGLVVYGNIGEYTTDKITSVAIVE